MLAEEEGKIGAGTLWDTFRDGEELSCSEAVA